MIATAINLRRVILQCLSYQLEPALDSSTQFSSPTSYPLSLIFLSPLSLLCYALYLERPSALQGRVTVHAGGPHRGAGAVRPVDPHEH